MPGPDLVGALQAQDLQQPHHLSRTTRAARKKSIRSSTASSGRQQRRSGSGWAKTTGAFPSSSDNAGVIQFNDDYNLVFKVETHNSPSALDPYGGALTGIVGVNRDPFGTGKGAKLIFNTDVFCFAPPDYDKPLPKRILHPRRIYDGVREGVEHGGNKSGIPTVNGCIVFDERYLGKPLVYCGTGGIMPARINGEPTHTKEIIPGDLIVMTGGRIGKDGIHGATFSSEELHEGSPVTAVQIGDPITQKKMTDFLLMARDRDLYRAITDNGAGGLSSSVGEMAQTFRRLRNRSQESPPEICRAATLGDPALRSPGADDPGRGPREAGRIPGPGGEDGGGGHRPRPYSPIRGSSISATGMRPSPTWTWISSMTAFRRCSLQARWRPPRHEEPDFPEPATWVRR